MPNDPRAHPTPSGLAPYMPRAGSQARGALAANIDQMLNAGRQKLDAKQGEAEEELKRKLAKLKQQMADTLAYMGDDEPDEPPAQPPSPGQRRFCQTPRKRLHAPGRCRWEVHEHMAARQAHGISKPFVL